MDMMKLVKKTLQFGVGVSMFILAAGGLSFIPGASAAGDFVSGIYGIPYLGNVIAVAGGFGILFGAIYLHYQSLVTLLELIRDGAQSLFGFELLGIPVGGIIGWNSWWNWFLHRILLHPNQQ